MIQVEGICTSYDRHVALEGVDLEVPPGRVTGLLGMNGSGKSTLFKTIMGLVEPDRGRVLLNGHSPAQARRQGLVGYVPQSEEVDWDFPVSVHDVVMMGRYANQGPLRCPRRQDRDAVATALGRLGLDALADRQIGQLSGGQRKRAFVARALAQGAGILLLDEPFAGVDATSEATLVGLLRELAADGATILVATHDIHALPDLVDDAVLLLRRVLFHGPVAHAVRPENLALAFGGGPQADGEAA